MRKIILTILLLSACIMIAGAQEVQIPKLSLDEFIAEYLPDYRIEKQFELDGTARDFAVAKDTGDIVAVTQLEDGFIVYFFDSKGNMLWDKKFDTSSYYLRCRISDNGVSIVITTYRGAMATNIVIDNQSNILFEKKRYAIELIPTSDGRYFYEKGSPMSSREKGVFICDLSGNEIEISGFDFSDKNNVTLHSLKENYLFAFMNDSFLLFEFSNGHFEKKWEHIPPKYNYPISNKIASNDSLIFISVPSLEPRSFLFDYSGNILYSDDKRYVSSDFTHNFLILSGITANYRLLRIYDLSTKERSDHKNPFVINNKKHQFTDITSIDNYFFFNLFKGYQPPFVNSFLLDNKFSLVGSLDCEVQKNNSKYIFLCDNNSKSEMLILGGNDEN